MFLWVLLAYMGFHLLDVVPGDLNQVVFALPLPSGAVMQPTFGDLMLVMGLAALFIEVLKSTRTDDTSIIDHVLSTFVLTAYLVLLLIEPWAGNAYFMLLTLMSLLDVIAGFTVTIAAARRDIDVGR
jgi:hypothetical protein